MDSIFALLAFLGLSFVLIMGCTMLIAPGLILFWLLLLKTLRVPYFVALWNKWEREFATPKMVVALAKTAKRLNEERSDLERAMTKLSIGTVEWHAMKEELESGKIPLNQNNYYLAQAVIDHLEKIGELK